MNVILSTLSLAVCIYLIHASKELTNCKLFGPTPICAICKVGECGAPKTFDNYCELVKYNKENSDTEFEYYHDEKCNDLKPVKCDDCNSLECDKEDFDPVCAILNNTCGRPVTLSNYCWLEKFNCEIPDCQFQYFHDGVCYTDLPED